MREQTNKRTSHVGKIDILKSINISAMRQQQIKNFSCRKNLSKVSAIHVQKSDSKAIEKTGNKEKTIN